MTYLRRCALASAVLFALVCIACSSYPEEQLKQAQAAMDEALKQQPEIFAATDWRDAKKTWDDAQAQLTQKKYGRASSLLITAKSRFTRAGQIAGRGRDVVLREVKNNQEEINSRHASLKSELASLRLSAPVRKSLEDCCLQVEKQMARLNSEIEQGQIQKAQATAKETLKLVYEGQVKLEAVRKLP